MNDRPATLSLEELANSFCLMMANAYRLIEDGEKLNAAGRPLGAIGSFQSATDELVRGHLITKAVLLGERDTAGWQEFWSAMDDRSKRLEILASEIHPEIYRTDDSRKKYRPGSSLLTLDFVFNTMDPKTGCFTPPGGSLNGLSSMEEAAKNYYEYVIGLYHAFNFYGLPNPATQAQTFWGMRMGVRNESLAR